MPSAKCHCSHCGQRLEFPVENAGSVIACPQCQQETQLQISDSTVPAEGPAAAAASLSSQDIASAFTGRIPPKGVSVFYQFGLLIVALAMVALPLVYFALIGLAAWATYQWGIHGTFLLPGGGGGFRFTIFKSFAYVTPIFAGLIVVLFMLKPLLARPAPHSQPLALNEDAEPVLFAFIRQICWLVDAPLPSRIDVNCELNASAGFRRGAASLFSNDLVLTIGLPLAAGMNLREFAGVMAHEFGHFTQGLGMRLSYVIRRINHWFARVIHQRDSWDLALDEWGESQVGYVSLMVFFARLAVGLSRLILALLMRVGDGISCFLLRQMEYDADHYEIYLAGSESSEATTKRLHTLGFAVNQAYKAARVSWNNNRHLPDNFVAFIALQDEGIPPETRGKIEDTLGLKRTRLFDTHPAAGDRIRNSRKANVPGVFHLEGPARHLFSNFDALSRQVTLLHYSEDLGIPLPMAKLRPVHSPPSPAEDVPAAPVVEEVVQPGKLRIRGRMQSAE